MRVSFETVTQALLAFDEGFAKVATDDNDDQTPTGYISEFWNVANLLGWSQDDYISASYGRFKASYFGKC